MRDWRGNPHWMIRDADPDPTRDPDPEGCDLCGWIDEGGIEASDLIWSPPRSASGQGAWLCMECD